MLHGFSTRHPPYIVSPDCAQYMSSIGTRHIALLSRKYVYCTALRHHSFSSDRTACNTCTTYSYTTSLPPYSLWLEHYIPTHHPSLPPFHIDQSTYLSFYTSASLCFMRVRVSLSRLRPSLSRLCLRVGHHSHSYVSRDNYFLFFLFPPSACKTLVSTRNKQNLSSNATLTAHKNART